MGGKIGHKVSQRSIDALKGYSNSRIGKKGSGSSGTKHTEEWKANRRLRKRPEEERKRVSEALKLAYATGKKVASWTGKKFSDEHRKKISDSVPKGADCNFWKGGITPTYKKRRYENLKLNGGHHSVGEWETLKAQYNWTCPHCSRIEPEIKLTKDHIIPVFHGGSSNIENIQPLCAQCNSRKNDRI